MIVKMIVNKMVKWLGLGAMVAAGMATAMVSASAETKKY